jgi:hypothetical protein
MNVQQVIAILDRAVGGPDASVGPPHGAFWRGLTRDQFVQKKVLGLALVALGDGAHSNLVLALKGQAPFGKDLQPPPPGARFPRMPAGLDPVPDDEISRIEQWINDSCPEAPVVPEVS